MTLAGVASLQLHLHSEAATRAPAVEQVARDAELMQVRVAEAEQAGRDAELAQGCEAAEAAPASTSPGEVATRPGRKCEPRNPSTGSLRQQVVEKCCPKCGPFKRTYDRLAVGSIVASLRLNGPMGGKRRHLLRGKELWLYLCRRHDHHMCSSEIHNVIRRDTRHVVSQCLVKMVCRRIRPHRIGQVLRVELEASEGSTFHRPSQRSLIVIGRL